VALLLVAAFLALAATAAPARSLREDADGAVRVERDFTYGTAINDSCSMPTCRASRERRDLP
jgi:hypothetical protein